MRKLMMLLFVIPLLSSCQNPANVISAISQVSSSSVDSLMDEEKWDAAIKACDDKLKEDPKDAETLANRAWCMFKLENYKSALENANQALAIDPKSSMAYYSRGWVYHDLHDYPDAKQNFDKELEIDGDDAPALVSRAQTMSDEKQYSKAFPDLEKALKLDTDNESSYLTRGAAYDAMGEYHKAIDDFNSAINEDDTDPVPYFDRALTLMHQGKYDEAIKDFDHSRALDAGYNNDWQYKGFIELFQDQPENAIKELIAGREHANQENAQWNDLYLYLTNKYMHNDKGAAEVLADAKQRAHSADWPAALVSYVRGDLSAETLQKLATSRAEQTEARFWIGFQKLVSGNSSLSGDFKWVVDCGDTDTNEYELALYGTRHPDFWKHFQPQ